jgi:threonine dehydratase
VLGQATCTLEILDALPGLGTLLVPVGGGGLLAGACLAADALGAAVEVVGVEPAGAAKLSAALEAGQPTALAETGSLADGLLPVSLGAIPWRHVRGRVRRAVRVDDAAIAEAVRFLFRFMGLRVEPSGAVPVAALLSGGIRPAGTTALILSGGNMDPALFARLIS